MLLIDQFLVLNICDFENVIAVFIYNQLELQQFFYDLQMVKLNLFKTCEKQLRTLFQCFNAQWINLLKELTRVIWWGAYLTRGVYTYAGLDSFCIYASCLSTKLQALFISNFDMRTTGCCHNNTTYSIDNITLA